MTNIRYYQEIKFKNATCSLDKLRLIGRSSIEEGERLSRLLSQRAMRQYTSFKPFAYKYQYEFRLNGASVVIGVGLNEVGKQESSKNFIEFNPNKVGSYIEFQEILTCFKTCCKDVEVAEWDFACDFPTARENFRLAKTDKRNYAFYLSGSRTEYLGKRHTDGFTKLYDKQHESNLSEPLTRLEITFRGLKPWEEVEHLIPVVRMFNADADFNEVDGLTQMDKWILKRIQESDEPELLISELSKDKKRKLKPVLSANSTSLSIIRTMYDSILAQVAKYENRIFKPFTEWVYVSPADPVPFD